jgi:inorganic pyrophosphatase
MAPDGEEQDAYIIGVSEPVEEFSGKVIAIIHRKDDIEGCCTC